MQIPIPKTHILDSTKKYTVCGLALERKYFSQLMQRWERVNFKVPTIAENPKDTTCKNCKRKFFKLKP